MITAVFDTETSGFPLWNAPNSDVRQPHLVQLAVLVTDADGIVTEWNSIVKCPVEIAPGAVAVHGISTRRSQREGISLLDAVNKFDSYILMVDRVVCHNIKFDLKIMNVAYHRAGISSKFLNELPHICTMLTATPVLKIHSTRGYKWPKLQEAYKVLVDEAGFDAAHSADADTLACWMVLRVLEEKGAELL